MDTAAEDETKPDLKDGSDYDLPIEIWDKILEHCNIIDIFQMRSVCKHWREMIMEIKKWSKMCIRLDSQEVVEKFLGHIKDHGFNYMPVHSIVIDRLQKSEELELALEAIAPNVISLNVISAPVFDNLAGVDLINLERLEITWWDSPPSQVTAPDTWQLKNYTNLKAISCFWPDEDLVWGKRILFEMLDASDCIQLEELCFTYHGMEDEYYMELIKLHTVTLQHLQIRFNTRPFPRFEDGWAETLGKLKKLKAMLISGNCNLKFARIVFRNLPRDAVLKSVELDGIFYADDALLKLIIDKWTWSLQTLCIRFNRGITINSAREIWRTRKNFQDLELAFCNEFDVKELIAAVAVERNCAMRRLSCYYLQHIRDDTMCKLAICLPNLEILDLSNCYGAVTNRSLSWIFRYQTHLKILNLSGSISISDTANEFQDEPEWDKYPVTRLKKLETLSLKRCSTLTKKFASLIKMPYLRSLHLCGSKALEFEDFCMIVDNNPALEDLDVSDCRGLTDEALYYICDNLKRLTKLDCQECKDVTMDATHLVEKTIKKVEYSDVSKTEYHRLYGRLYEADCSI